MVRSNEHVVIVTLGNDLRGDDGAGILFGNMLSESVNGSKKLKIVNAGDTPENYAGVIEAMNPKTIIIADAMDNGGKPGEILIVPGIRLAKESSSTHGSLKMFVDYLEKTTGAKILILGFQPKSTSLGEEISPEIYESVQKAANMICSLDSVAEAVEFFCSGSENKGTDAA
jgi:hydrogenase 3 maturation protease